MTEVPQFATTRWSMVLAAAGDEASEDASTALESLCSIYWYPLYAYARRRGRPPEDAQDLTQEFFARLLEKDYLETANPKKGRFRSFLLTMFKRFLAKERDRDAAQKRGGGHRPLSIDLQTSEDRYRLEPSHDWTPERIFERRWAMTLLDRVLQRLTDEFAERNKTDLFTRCKICLTRSSDADSHAQIAAELQMSTVAVKVAVHRMRQRYRELLKEEISQTVTSPEELDDELNALRCAIRAEKS